jgi:acetolactate synthase, small subunit
MDKRRIRTFIAYVEDRPGVLNRVASLFRRRGFNIDSLTVGRTHIPGISRMTVMIDADPDTARRIEANLYKIVNVLWVEDITEVEMVMRDLVLIKVRATMEQRPHILQLCEVFRAKVVDIGSDALIIESTGTQDKLDSLLEVLQPFEVLEMVRSGAIAMTRGARFTPIFDRTNLRPGEEAVA